MYVESDPIGLSNGVNTYTYALDNPIGVSDPSGRQAVVEDPDPMANTVVCDDWGNLVPQLVPLDPLGEKCISDCILVHENSHIDDLIRIGPKGVCHGRRSGNVVTLATMQQRFDSEKKAYAAELECLVAKLAKMNCGDECKKAVTDRINQITPLVKHPPGFPLNFGG
jgi:hypothetical protein